MKRTVGGLDVTTHSTPGQVVRVAPKRRWWNRLAEVDWVLVVATAEAFVIGWLVLK